MIEAKVNIKLIWNIPPSGQGRFWQKFKKECNDAAKFSAVMYRQHLRDLINIAVGRSATGKVIQRSLPGEHPRKETGDLQRGITIGQDRRNLYTIIYSEVDYASELEHGSVKIAPRPAWLPAFLAQWQIMAYYIEARLANFINTYTP